MRYAVTSIAPIADPADGANQQFKRLLDVQIVAENRIDHLKRIAANPKLVAPAKMPLFIDSLFSETSGHPLITEHGQATLSRAYRKIMEYVEWACLPAGDVDIPVDPYLPLTDETVELVREFIEPVVTVLVCTLSRYKDFISEIGLENARDSELYWECIKARTFNMLLPRVLARQFRAYLLSNHAEE